MGDPQELTPGKLNTIPSNPMHPPLRTNNASRTYSTILTGVILISSVHNTGADRFFKGRPRPLKNTLVPLTQFISKGLFLW
jgi:hypothetical protein